MRHRPTVIGAGHLEATQAACRAEPGFDALGLDPDAAKVAWLRSGEAAFHQPGLQPPLRRGPACGRWRTS